jgi:flagellar biosynthesis protein FlhF
MIIKKYFLKTIDEVQQLINQELGPNAVILTSRQIRYKGIKALFFQNKVEVVAAIDEEDLNQFNKIKNESKQMGSLSAEPQNLDLELIEQGSRVRGFSLNQNLIDLKEKIQSIKDKENSSVSQFKKSSFYHSKDDAEVENIAVKESDISEIYNNLPHEFECSTLGTDSSNYEEMKRSKVHRHFALLKKVGIDSAIVSILQKRVFDYLQSHQYLSGDSTLILAMQKEIAALVNTFGPICLLENSPTIAAFIGPSGVGKTTVLMKLALQYSETLEKKVVLISFGSHQTGPENYISNLPETFGIDYSQAPSDEILQQELLRFGDADLILIDTPGCSQFQKEQIHHMKEVFEKNSSIKTHLVISAASKDEDIRGTIKEFGCLHLDSIIFTKLDETSSKGCLLNACYHSGIPISYLSTGSQIPIDIKIADPEDIAKEFTKSS